MKTGDLFDPAVRDAVGVNTARQLRDEGINRVLASNATWVHDAMHALDVARVDGKLPAEFTGEDLRGFLAEKGIVPSKAHAWGALTRTLAISGRIVDTGRVRKMADPRSHARRTPIWRWAQG